MHFLLRWTVTHPSWVPELFPETCYGFVPERWFSKLFSEAVIIDIFFPAEFWLKHSNDESALFTEEVTRVVHLGWECLFVSCVWEPISSTWCCLLTFEETMCEVMSAYMCVWGLEKNYIADKWRIFSGQMRSRSFFHESLIKSAPNNGTAATLVIFNDFWSLKGPKQNGDGGFKYSSESVSV